MVVPSYVLLFAVTVAVTLALVTVRGKVPLLLAPKLVPLMVAAVNEAATLWVETDNEDGL